MHAPEAEKKTLNYGLVNNTFSLRNFLGPLTGVVAWRFSRTVPLVVVVLRVDTDTPEFVQLLVTDRSVETTGVRVTLLFVRAKYVSTRFDPLIEFDGRRLVEIGFVPVPP